MADKSARDRVAAVVLAAGGSTRMGRPKALLPLRGKTYLEVALGTLGSCDVEPLLVLPFVTPQEADVPPSSARSESPSPRQRALLP